MRPFHPSLAVSALLVATCLLTPDVAVAGDEARAARFEAKAKKAYVNKRWPDAIAAFDAAYRADPKPKYLFNIAKAYEQKGDLDRAVQYAKKYVAEATDEDDKTDGQDLLTMLEIKQEHIAAATPPPEAKPEPQPKPAPAPPPARTPPPADMVRAAKAAATPAPAEAPAPKEVRSKDTIPQGALIVYVGAAALFAGGMLLGAEAKKFQDDRDALQYSSVPVRLTEIDELDILARDRAKAANALYLLSFASAGAGAIWQFTADSSATLIPVPGGAMFSVEFP